MGYPRILLVLILVHFHAYGGEVLNTQASYEKSEFHIITSMVIKGDSQQVFDILTDYQQLAQVSEIVLSSHKITENRSLEDGPIRVGINTRTCVLFFCFKARIVEDVEILNEVTLKAVIVPELSDFKSGEIIIQVLDYPDNQTLVSFESRFTPDFWVPPIIGPMIIKRKTIQTSTHTIFQIEKLLNSE